MGTPMAAKEMEKFIVFKIGFQLHRLAAPLPGLLLLIFLRRPPGAPIIRITPIALITPMPGSPMAATAGPNALKAWPVAKRLAGRPGRRSKSAWERLYFLLFFAIT
jgi:hypothetical protein